MALKKIVANAKPVPGVMPKKPHAKAARKGVKLVYVLKSAVSIAGQKEVMRLVVYEREDGSMFYDHAIDREEMAALGRNAGALDSADAADLNPPALHHKEPSLWQRREENVDDNGSHVNLDSAYQINQSDTGTLFDPRPSIAYS